MNFTRHDYYSLLMLVTAIGVGLNINDGRYGWAGFGIVVALYVHAMLVKTKE